MGKIKSRFLLSGGGFTGVVLRKRRTLIAEFKTRQQFPKIHDVAIDQKMMVDNCLARMILATSLMIEVCYYASEILPKQGQQEHLRGKYLGCVDPKSTSLIATSYDARLWRNYLKIKGGR